MLWARSLSSHGTCTRWCSVNRRRAWCHISGDHTWNGTHRQGKVCNAPIEEGGARIQQCNDETNELDEILTTSWEIRTNFVRISQKLLYSPTCQAYSFVRISYHFHVNFVQFGSRASKHTSKHTLQSHGQVNDHAPAFEHLGSRRTGAMLRRCHSVVCRTGGATPEMTKWICDSTSMLPPRGGRRDRTLYADSPPPSPPPPPPPPLPARFWPGSAGPWAPKAP